MSTYVQEFIKKHIRTIEEKDIEQLLIFWQTFSSAIPQRLEPAEFDKLVDVLKQVGVIQNNHYEIQAKELVRTTLRDILETCSRNDATELHVGVIINQLHTLLGLSDELVRSMFFMEVRRIWRTVSYDSKTDTVHIG